MPFRLRPFGLCAVLLLAAAPAAADAPTPAETELTHAFVAEVEALGRWCNQASLFHSRNELARVILRLDPDHPRARAWLKYRRARDGTWVRRKPGKPPMDMKPEALPDFRRRHDALLTSYRKRLVSLLRDAQPPLDYTRRLAAVTRWRPVFGDAPDLLGLLGMVKHDGAWLDADTVRSLARHREIVAAAKAARHLELEVRTAPVGAVEAGLHVRWGRGVRTDRATVQGTASARFHESVLRTVLATQKLATTFLGGEMPLPPAWTIYVMDGEADFETIVDEHPAVQGNRKLLRKLSGCWLGWNVFVDRMESEAGSLDSAVNVTMQVLLARRFGKGDSRWMPGWVADGFGLYAMTYLTGTHLSFTVDLGRYGQDPLFKSLFRQKTDWLGEARTMMLGRDPQPLRLALGKKIGHLGPRDFLAGYAFVAWLLEARSQQETNALLAALAAGLDVDAAFAKSLKMRVEDAEAHLKRWLAQTRRPS